jgi:hypothetical protein
MSNFFDIAKQYSQPLNEKDEEDDFFQSALYYSNPLKEVEEPDLDLFDLELFDSGFPLDDGEVQQPSPESPVSPQLIEDSLLRDGEIRPERSSKEFEPMSSMVAPYSSHDQDATFAVPFNENFVGQTEFSVQQGLQVPKVQKELSSDPSRNGILNALIYFEGKDNSTLIQEYARQVVNEAHLPVGDRPKNAKYARQNKEVREEIESASDIGFAEEWIREFADSFEDRDFIKPRRYENKLFQEETIGLDPFIKEQIEEQLNFFRPIAEKMSPEDLIRDSTKSNSAAVNFLGDAAGIFTFPVVIAGSLGSTFLGSGKLGPRETTVHGEQVGADINAAKTYSVTKKIRNYRKKSDDTLEPLDVVYNIATNGSPGFSDIQGYSELSLRGLRSEKYTSSPKLLPHEAAQVLNSIEKDKEKIKDHIRSDVFTDEQLEKIKKTPGGIENAVERTFQDAVNFLFVRNREQIPKSINNTFATTVADFYLSEYLPEETEGEKLGKVVEDAQSFMSGSIRRAFSAEGKKNRYRDAFEKVTGSKNINISDNEFQRKLNEYIFSEVQKFSEQAAKEGDFGKSWSKSPLQSKAAGIVIATFNAQNRPEYADALSEYGGRFADAVFSEETFDDMVFDSWLGFSNGASREQQLRTQKKWEQHPLYAALDLAAVGVVFGKIGKVAGLTRRSYQKAVSAAQAGNNEPLRRLFMKAYAEEKKHIEAVKIRPDKDKFAATNFAGSSSDMPVDLKLSNAEEASILHSERKAAEYRQKAAETEDPALKQQLEKDAIAEEELAQSKLDYYKGIDTEEGGVARFANETLETSSKEGLKVRRRYAEDGKALRGQDIEQRTQYFYNDSLNDVKIVDELYKENPGDAARLEAKISAEVDELAKSNNIKPDNTMGVINSLIDAGYTDPQYFRHVVYNSSSPKISKTPETVAGFMVQSKELSYRTGTAKRLKTIQDIVDDSPVSVLSDSAKIGKDDFLNRRDS